ncbi:MAG: alpha/beta hydrolase [Acidobacteriia bacterium]|nr:alpha/beta hydrolase [Terriglobia bacterium]
MLGEKDDEHEFTREWVRVQWRANDPIDLFVILPKGVKKPPVILYLFSFPSEADRFENDDYCKLLTKDGVAAVGFLSAVTGERFHPPRRLKDWFVSEMPEALATSAHDVQMILNYLQKRGDLDMDRVGMFGDGSGASIAILAAAVDPRIKTLDLLDPWGDWPEWLANSTLVPENERADYVKAEFLERLAPLDPVKWFPELKSRQVRLQVVGDITVTPKTAMQAVAAAAPPNVKVVRYPDRKAYFLQEATSSKIFEWIKGQVQASGSAHHPNTENAERSRSVSKVEEAQR